MNVQAFNAIVADRYPQLVDWIDWWFEDPGTGVFLAKWPDGLALPTETEVAARGVELSLKSALKANNDAYSAATRAITTDYPQLEKDTWPTQDKESKAWVADPNNALTPWIDRAAARRGLSREEYLRRTLAKAWQFEVISSYLTGTRQNYEDQIKAGGNPALDYTIPPSVYAELQAQSMQIMSTPTADLQGIF